MFCVESGEVEMPRRLLAFFLLLIGATTVCAEDMPVVFSSTYTSLAQECTWAYSDEELSDGQDNALLCAEVSGYQIYIYFSAMDAWLTVRLKDEPDTEAVHDSVGGIDEANGVVEWRRADGVPFAIIVRSRKYASPEAGGKRVGEMLVVRGLGQYSAISGVVPVSKKNANEEARRLADAGFKQKQPKHNRNKSD